MSIGEPQTYTPEDLLTMPDGDRYELVNGDPFPPPRVLDSPETVESE